MRRNRNSSLNIQTESPCRRLTRANWPSVLVLALVWLAVSPASLTFAREEPAGRAAAPAVKQANSETSSRASAKRPKDRAASVAALCAKLGLGQGAVVADVGAGRGPDTWVFARIVGPSGTVYAEEIAKGLVESLKREAEKRNLTQVQVVLGREDDPCLPHDCLDLAHMHYVYHHVSKPREMLRGIWRALKPGGYFVVVDQHRGTLRDWVPREQRKNKHFWIAETTVVREAREEGFAFVTCAEECCESSEPFVLIFQRPKDRKQPGGDPDAFLPLAEKDGYRRLLPLGAPYQRPVFIALGEARRWMAPILERSAGPGLEIVLEEWATQKDERPPLPSGISLPSVLTDNGDPKLEDKPIDVVFFLDSYHLLFHGQTLLAKLHEKLVPSGCVYILDRKAQRPLSRREASHRRQIDPQTVREEMAAAGFCLWCEGPSPAPDRFLLVFGKSKPEELAPGADPLLGGPEVVGTPEEWLHANRWRLRGLKTADGKLVRLTSPGDQGPFQRANSTAPDTETWKLPKDQLLLVFRKTDKGYVLAQSRALNGRE
jgi:predicted methyltransferase